MSPGWFKEKNNCDIRTINTVHILGEILLGFLYSLEGYVYILSKIIKEYEILGEKELNPDPNI